MGVHGLASAEGAKMKRLAVCAAAAGMVCGGWARAAAPSGKVVCFGDTITYADGSAKNWPALLAAKGTGITAVNASERSRTTASADAFRRVIEANDDAALFLLMLGTMDMKEPSGYTVQECCKNVGAMVDEIRSRAPNAAVAICAPPNIVIPKLTDVWRRKWRFGVEVETHLQSLAAAYRNLAVEKKAGFVDLLKAVSPANVYDGVNVGPEGQEEIAEAVWQRLQAPDLVPRKIVAPAGATRARKIRLSRGQAIGLAVCVALLVLLALPFVLLRQRRDRDAEEDTEESGGGE